VFVPYAPPTQEFEFYYARLPFHESQSVFGSTSVKPATEQIVQMGWHGTALDPERGSFAVVDENGPLAGLIGERVKITRLTGKRAVVYAWVYNSMSLPEVTNQAIDLSVPRRLWMAMALPGDDVMRVLVETMS
jgi:hypothetical protein